MADKVKMPNTIAGHQEFTIGDKSFERVFEKPDAKSGTPAPKTPNAYSEGLANSEWRNTLQTYSSYVGPLPKHLKPYITPDKSDPAKYEKLMFSGDTEAKFFAQSIFVEMGNLDRSAKARLEKATERKRTGEERDPVDTSASFGRAAVLSVYSNADRTGGSGRWFTHERDAEQAVSRGEIRRRYNDDGSFFYYEGGKEGGSNSGGTDPMKAKVETKDGKIVTIEELISNLYSTIDTLNKKVAKLEAQLAGEDSDDDGDEEEGGDKPKPLTKAEKIENRRVGEYEKGIEELEAKKALLFKRDPGLKHNYDNREKSGKFNRYAGRPTDKWKAYRQVSRLDYVISELRKSQGDKSSKPQYSDVMSAGGSIDQELTRYKTSLAELGGIN
jgi:hypothetical protein